MAACGVSAASPAKVSGPPRRGGKIVFARTADCLSVDPAAVSDNESIWVVSNLYDRLYQSSKTGGATLPCLATRYTLSADKRTWTFHLRSGVRFSDGTTLAAADVKFSIDRSTASDANGYMNVAIESVTAPDDRTVVIRTKYPTELLGVVSYYANGVVPKDFRGRDAATFFAAPVGTGAFTMTSWAVGRQMVLQRNQHSWRTEGPYLDQITLTVVPDDDTRTLQLRGQQVDIIEAPPWSQLSTIRDESGSAVQLFPSTLVNFLSLNERVAPLKDVPIRRAMSLAMDREAIVKLGLFGYGQAAGSIFPPTWPDYDASIKAPQRDVAAARKALAASTFPRGFQLKHSIDGGDTVQAAVAQIVQSNLKEIGIDVKILQYDSNTLATLVGENDFQMFHDSLSLDIMDPRENVPYMVDPSVGGDAAYADYRVPEVIAWSNQAQETIDQATVRRAYEEIQQQIQLNCPFLPMYYSPYSYATSTRLQGLVVPPTGDYRLQDLWLAT
jgi:peptide/nickel transport system substrate-binding protein